MKYNMANKKLFKSARSQKTFIKDMFSQFLDTGEVDPKLAKLVVQLELGNYVPQSLIYCRDYMEMDDWDSLVDISMDWFEDTQQDTEMWIEFDKKSKALMKSKMIKCIMVDGYEEILELNKEYNLVKKEGDYITILVDGEEQQFFAERFGK